MLNLYVFKNDNTSVTCRCGNVVKPGNPYLVVGNLRSKYMNITMCRDCAGKLFVDLKSLIAITEEKMKSVNVPLFKKRGRPRGE